MPGKNLYRNDHRSSAYNRKCDECMDQTLKSYIIELTVMILSFIGALIGPIYTYLQDGTLVTLYEVRIPFLMEHPRTEFVINMIWQAYISVLGIFALFGIEGCIAIVNNAITVSSNLTLNELKTLSDRLEMNEIRNKHLAKSLKTILLQISFMDE